MPLVTTKEILEDACKNRYAIGAFAAHNLEILKAVIGAAESLQTPVIIQTTPGTIRYVGIHYVSAMVRTAAKESSVPVALHLDHGDHFDTVVQCLRAGYTSVMIDGSRLPLEENIALVRKVTETAHAASVPVEAELGTIGGVEDDLEVEEGALTDPEVAEQFVASTGIDSFAPAFGTAHGLYKKEPNLQFGLLKDISDRTGIPLVMHGASGVSEQGIQKAIQCGASKVNFSTELKEVFVEQLRNYLIENPGESDPRKYFIPARETVQELVGRKIETLQALKKSGV